MPGCEPRSPVRCHDPDVVLKFINPWYYRGLFAFASTALVLSLYNVHARHVTVPNVAVGMALFYGGLAELLAGMWGFAAGSTLAATGEFQGFFYRPGSFRGTHVVLRSELTSIPRRAGTTSSVLYGPPLSLIIC